MAPRWVLDGNALFNDTATVDDTIRIRRPEGMANLGVQYRGGDGRLGLRANVRRSDGAVDELFGIGRLPLADYDVLDVSGACRLDSGVEVFVRVENLFDESFQEIIGFNTPDRTVFAGLRLRLD